MPQPDAVQPLKAWSEEVLSDACRQPSDINAHYRCPSVLMNRPVGFNIKRTAFRLIVEMSFKLNLLFVYFRNTTQHSRSNLGSGLFHPVIKLDTKLRESPIAGQPIAHYKSAARGSTQYRVLAQELMEYAKETENQQTS